MVLSSRMVRHHYLKRKQKLLGSPGATSLGYPKASQGCLASSMNEVLPPSFELQGTKSRPCAIEFSAADASILEKLNSIPGNAAPADIFAGQNSRPNSAKISGGIRMHCASASLLPHSSQSGSQIPASV